jgi:hypothetical protein
MDVGFGPSLERSTRCSDGSVPSHRLRCSPLARPAARSASLAAAAPKAPSEIKVFSEAPPEGYVPVAVISAKQAPFNPDGTNAMLGKMLARAGELGCDGLVLGVQDHFIGTSGPLITHGWNGIMQQLPQEAYVAQTWFGVEPPAALTAGEQETPDHWTLEGYQAECLVLR